MIKNYEIFSGKDLEVADTILRHRMQMLVHSYLYYEMDTNLISDRDFDMWGKELAQLQNEYPEIAAQVEYAEAFKDWDGTTGFHLPKNEQVIRIANRLLRINAVGGEYVKTKPQIKQAEKPKPKSKTSGRKSLF